MIMKSGIAGLVLMLIGISPLYADAADDFRYESRKVLLPIIGYSPETSLMMGGFAMRQFKPAGAGPETRSSQLLAAGIYTLNKQATLELMSNIILPGERWIFDSRLEYIWFPQKYWGVGPETRNRDELSVEYRTYGVDLLVLRKLEEGVYAGPKISWNRLTDFAFMDDSDIRAPESEFYHEDGNILPGINDGSNTLPGFGLSFRWDKRNSFMTPASGPYLELTGMIYPDLIGSTHPHKSLLLDARHYFDIRGDKRSVIAFHFRSNLTSGTLPFQAYSPLGGQEIMRGYYGGRFRDYNAAQIQTEFRQAVWWRFGVVAFAGAGEVWGRFDAFTLANPKLAAGAGLRFDLNPEDTSNIRIDYGMGRHGNGLYITIGEAF